MLWHQLGHWYCLCGGTAVPSSPWVSPNPKTVPPTNPLPSMPTYPLSDSDPMLTHIERIEELLEKIVELLERLNDR